MLPTLQFEECIKYDYIAKVLTALKYDARLVVSFGPSALVLEELGKC